MAKGNNNRAVAGMGHLSGHESFLSGNLFFSRRRGERKSKCKSDKQFGGTRLSKNEFTHAKNRVSAFFD